MLLSPFILHITDFNIILWDTTIAYMNQGWGQNFECKLFFFLEGDKIWVQELVWKEGKF